MEMMGMFNLKDKIVDTDGIKGEVVDLDPGAEFPIGVQFEDDDTTVWWMKEEQIEKV
jgi:hypothetical protein